MTHSEIDEMLDAIKDAQTKIPTVGELKGATYKTVLELRDIVDVSLDNQRILLELLKAYAK